MQYFPDNFDLETIKRRTSVQLTVTDGKVRIPWKIDQPLSESNMVSEDVFSFV